MLEDRKLTLAAAFAVLAIVAADAARAGGTDETGATAAESVQREPVHRAPVHRTPVHRTPGTIRRADSFDTEDRYGLDADGEGQASAYLTSPRSYVIAPYVAVEIDAGRWRRRGARAPR